MLLNQRTAINGARAEIYDKTTSERLDIMSAWTFYDDFFGQAHVTIPTSAAPQVGYPWCKKIVGSGPPTVAGVANSIGGQVACALTSTSEKEDAVHYWGDNLSIDITKGAIYETRAQLSVLPSAASVQAVWGLASVWIDGPNNNTCFARFGATANGAILIETFDGVTTNSIATGITVLATDWHIYRIDATNIADIRFYIDGVQVSANGAVNFAATGALAVLQPYASVYKPSGVGVATLTMDFIKAWANRQ